MYRGALVVPLEPQATASLISGQAAVGRPLDPGNAQNKAQEMMEDQEQHTLDHRHKPRELEKMSWNS